MLGIGLISYILVASKQLLEEETDKYVAAGNITGDHRLTVAAGNISEDHRLTVAAGNITEDQRLTVATGNITEDHRLTVATGNITEDQRPTGRLNTYTHTHTGRHEFYHVNQHMHIIDMTLCVQTS